MTCDVRNSLVTLWELECGYPTQAHQGLAGWWLQHVTDYVQETLNHCTLTLRSHPPGKEECSTSGKNLISSSSTLKQWMTLLQCYCCTVTPNNIHGMSNQNRKEEIPATVLGMIGLKSIFSWLTIQCLA